MTEKSDTKATLDAVDLRGLSDPELLDHLDRVSSELKSRNNLLPRGSGPDVVKSMVDAIFSAVRPKP